MANRGLHLSPKENLIRQLLSSGQEMYGLELVGASRKRLKRGTVYVTLGRMEDKGFIESRLDETLPPGGGLPRRLYRPTALGLRVYALVSDVSRVLTPEVAS